MIDVRQSCHPEAVRGFDTSQLRQHFLVERLFVPGEVSLTYSHNDRLVVGGAMPAHGELELTAPKAIGSAHFLDRRELGVVNVGAKGSVTVDGAACSLEPLTALYVGLGARSVRFTSDDPGRPAKFYLVSTPAHARHETRRIGRGEARRVDLGDAERANLRTIYQMIHPDVCPSCQLVLGLTELRPGNVWNTMPAHTHDRRSEAYLYIGLELEARVVHLMGLPDETRHLIVANEQAIISPGWSVHSGAGTTSYAFVWAMAGENQDFADMDMVPMHQLR